MAYWAAAQLVPQKDRLALFFLGQAGFETYAPRLKAPCKVRGRTVVKTPLLFPGYLFVRIELQWHAARWAVGVNKLVMAGATPAAVPDPVIAELRRRECGGLIELPSRFRRGDPVRILGGPLRGQLALFQE